jgi:hypothetical protein
MLIFKRKAALPPKATGQRVIVKAMVLSSSTCQGLKESWGA